MPYLPRVAMALVTVIGLTAPDALVAQAPRAAALRTGPAGLRYRMLAAEDARAATRAEAAPLLEALAGPDSTLARLAVRALGRLENPIFVPDIRRALDDPDPLVRAEAANALGQAGGTDVAGTIRALRERLADESKHDVLAAAYATLGRVRHLSNDDRRVTSQTLAAALISDAEPVAVRIGAARGLDSLARSARGAGFVPPDAVVTALRRAATGSMRSGVGEDEARVRRLSLTALATLGLIDATFERAAVDRDRQVRRIAVAAMAGDAPAETRAPVVGVGLVDAEPLVRLEALRVHGRHYAATDCSVETESTKDPSVQVGLLAVDLLGTACPGDAHATTVLRTMAQGPSANEPTPGLTWHTPAHAIVALARRDAASARALLPALGGHPVWQVRMYAARAAAFTGDHALLETLAIDANANVREAAIGGLAQARGHEADEIYLHALEHPDYQVVMAVAAALKGTTAKAPAATALLKALATITAQRRETSRDPRLALLERVREVGSATHAAALRPYLGDFDPRVAAAAAETLTAWTGRPVAPRTTRLKTLALPPIEEFRGLPGSLRFTMASGRSFVVRLFVDDTPVSVWRVVRLARAGAYDGSTFHRIVPNFIVQGGSPGANEFVGDGPFMRDEFGLRSQTRGTVGISSRGHDTGDGQFYVNLIDNARLDHQYTIFGEVTEGMDEVDAILEGDVIARVELLQGR